MIDARAKKTVADGNWPIRVTAECAESIRKTHGRLFVEVALQTGRLEIIEDGGQ